MNVKMVVSKIRPILVENNIRKAEIVGSFARGNATSKSDIDILIEPKEVLSLFKLVDMRDKIANVTKRDIDLITYKSINPLIKENILEYRVKVI